MIIWNTKEQKNRVAIVSGVRTPFAKAATKLKDCSAVHLGVSAVRECLAKIDFPVENIDEVVLGNAGTPADAANIARVVALRSGVPENVPAYTVHRNCASAMEAVAQGCIKISTGLADTMIVGGTESMSAMPLLYSDEMKDLISAVSFAKTTTEKLEKLSHFRPNWLKPIISIMEGLTDPISGLNMGQTAEVLARDFSIRREEQDAFALRSHKKASAASKNGRFQEEITPLILQPSYDEFVEQDVGPRDTQTIEALAKLKPFFDKQTGTITPGNACPITDGAATLLLMNESKAKSLGLEIWGTIAGFSFSGCEPKRMGLGPVYATSHLLDRLGISLQEIELVELNEAFAAQVIANQKAFSSKQYCQEKLGRKDALGEIPDEILNVNGGAIALGHPVGATGARLILTLTKELMQTNKSLGLATLCIGGGQGASFLVERNG